ncbi:MAG: hypothetical protein U0640_08925 [Phycisphaerales bacterium]
MTVFLRARVVDGVKIFQREALEGHEEGLELREIGGGVGRGWNEETRSLTLGVLERGALPFGGVLTTIVPYGLDHEELSGDED